MVDFQCVQETNPMKTITLSSGTYAVDPILDGFEIIEKPSSNVAFVGTSMLEHKIYVQFKNGSGYIYSEVDYDTLSFVPIAESIGKFISSKVVKHFPSEKQEKKLIIEDALQGLNFVPFTEFADCQIKKITDQEAQF